MHIGRPLLRGFRALVFAVACTAVSAALHFAAGGSLIAAGPFTAAVAALAPIAYLMGGGQRGFPTLLAACAVAQTGLHLWFTAVSGHAHGLGSGPAMLSVHALAAVVSAVWLARGDAALAAFCDLLCAAFADLVRRSAPFDPPPARRPGPRPPWRELPDLRSAVLAAVRPLRGPPERAEATV